MTFPRLTCHDLPSSHSFLLWQAAEVPQGTLQALNSYEEAAKLQSGSDLSQKITSLKKAIRRGSSKVSPKAADKGSGSSFEFAGSNGSDATTDQQKSRIAKAPTVGAVKDDKDYEQAKKSMVS